MRYRNAMASSMPASIQDWLDKRLEILGIDAIVYTKYVLSILQHHSDVEDELHDFDTISAGHHSEFSSSNSSLPSNKRRNSNHKSPTDKRNDGSWAESVWKKYQNDPDGWKKSAAVQCLMAASEQKYDIEKLVDELCEKLKRLEHPGDKREDLPVKDVPGDERFESAKLEAHLRKADESKIQDGVKISVSNPNLNSYEEQAQKYYAAFPALNKGEMGLKHPTDPSSQTCWSNFRSVSKPDASAAANSVLAKLFRSNVSMIDTPANIQQFPVNYHKYGDDRRHSRQRRNSGFRKGGFSNFSRRGNYNQGRNYQHERMKTMSPATYFKRKLVMERGLRCGGEGEDYHQQEAFDHNSEMFAPEMEFGFEGGVFTSMGDAMIEQLAAKFTDDVAAIWCGENELEGGVGSQIWSAAIGSLEAGNIWKLGYEDACDLKAFDDFADGQLQSDDVPPPTEEQLSANPQFIYFTQTIIPGDTTWKYSPDDNTSTPEDKAADWSWKADALYSKWSQNDQSEPALLFDGKDELELIWEVLGSLDQNPEQLWGDLDGIPTKDEPQSKNLLNYHKGVSSFTEVIPRAIRTPLEKRGSLEEEIGVELPEIGSDLGSAPVEEEEVAVSAEEDLLTSSKTHFRPIRQESCESSSTDENGVIEVGECPAEEVGFVPERLGSAGMSAREIDGMLGLGACALAGVWGATSQLGGFYESLRADVEGFYRGTLLDDLKAFSGVEGGHDGLTLMRNEIKAEEDCLFDALSHIHDLSMSDFWNDAKMAPQTDLPLPPVQQPSPPFPSSLLKAPKSLSPLENMSSTTCTTSTMSSSDYSSTGDDNSGDDGELCEGAKMATGTTAGELEDECFHENIIAADLFQFDSDYGGSRRGSMFDRDLNPKPADPSDLFSANFGNSNNNMHHLTCRFWQDGICFKGARCPFYQGFASDERKDSTFDLFLSGGIAVACSGGMKGQGVGGGASILPIGSHREARNVDDLTKAGAVVV